RYFDADSQRSLDKVTNITVGPATELLLKKEDMLRAKERLEKELAKVLKKMKASEHREALLQSMNEEMEKLDNGELFQGIYKYRGLFYVHTYSLQYYMEDEHGLILNVMDRVT